MLQLCHIQITVIKSFQSTNSVNIRLKLQLWNSDISTLELDIQTNLSASQQFNKLNLNECVQYFNSHTTDSVMLWWNLKHLYQQHGPLIHENCSTGTFQVCVWSVGSFFYRLKDSKVMRWSVCLINNNDLKHRKPSVQLCCIRHINQFNMFHVLTVINHSGVFPAG